MDVIDAIYERRSVKNYDSTYNIKDEVISYIKNLIRQSPTSFNMQNWRFVFVEDEETRKQIRYAAWDQAQVTDSSHLIVLCADIKAHEKKPERYWEDAPKETQEILVPMIRQFYDGRERIQRDEAMRSVGIAAQTIMLAVKSIGYDSCPMIGFDADKVSKIINLPEDHVIGMMISIGKAKTKAHPKGGYLPDDEIFFLDSF